MPLKSGHRFDIVCANLIHDLLIAERARILHRVKSGGTLVLAGILHSQFPAVRQAYEAAGLKLKARLAEKEWESGAFVAI
jgi:ribosomal protein L11 methyltransferase